MQWVVAVQPSRSQQSDDFGPPPSDDFDDDILSIGGEVKASYLPADECARLGH